MPGLLNFMGDGWDDPKSAATLAFAHGLLSAPKGQGMAGAAQGLLAYQGVMSEAKNSDMKRKLLQGQIDENAAQTEQRRQAALAQQAQQQQAMRAAAALRNAGGPMGGPQAMAGGGGPTQANAAQIGQRAPIDFQALIREGVDPKLVLALAESRNYGRPKVARTVETQDAQGKPVTIQLDEHGQAVGEGMRQWKAPVQVDRGGAIDFRDPTSLAGQSFGKTMTPGEHASNSLGWANNRIAGGNLDLARQRLQMEQTAPKGQFDSERGVMIDPRTGQATPVMQGGQPIGPKNKDLNDTQAKAKLFGERMQQANSVLDKMATAGVDRPGMIHQGAQAIPLIGGPAAQATNWTQSKEQQQVAQAQRDFINAVLRRESGAAIATSEFENAQQQYFPTIGDSPEVREQKRRNRENATRLILTEVPAAHRGAASPSATPGLPDDINAILNRYNR